MGKDKKQVKLDLGCGKAKEAGMIVDGYFMFNYQAIEIETVKQYMKKLRDKKQDILEYQVPEKLDEYKALHANVWPGVLSKLKDCNIQNYSIHLKDSFLFGYLEYAGIDFEADMEKMAADSLTREWWKLTDPCQTPFESRKEGEWWAMMLTKVGSSS